MDSYSAGNQIVALHGKMAMKYVYLCLILFIFVFLAAPDQQVLAATGEQQTAPTEKLPPQKKPPMVSGASVPIAQATFYVLPPSPTRTGKDMCGNPSGTKYGEGFRCPELEEQQGPYITYKSPWEKSLTMIAAGMAAFFALLYLLFHVIAGDKIEEWAARNFIIILVVGSAVFVLTAGYDDKQAAPLFGLFGTLVGYLFGRAQQEQPAGYKTPRQPGGQPWEQPGTQPGAQPGGQPGAQPVGETGGQPGAQPAGQLGGQPEAQPRGQAPWQPVGLTD